MRVGAVDIGTNTIRLLVGEAGAAGWSELARRTEVVALGRGVDASRRLSTDAVDRALAVLAAYGEVMAVWDVERARAVATSAVRDAADSESFLRHAGSALGVAPEVISGEEEAVLSFAGATAGSPGPGPVLVIDPGGGSTEFVFGGERPEYAVSVDIGSVRLTDRLLPDRPASPEAVAAASAHVRDLLSGVELPGDPARVLGVAGTFTSLGAIDLGLRAHDRSIVHGSELTLGALERLVGRLAGLTVEETAAIPSLEPGRAPVLLAGAVVALEAVLLSGHDEVMVSEADLLDGLAMGLVG